MPERRPTPSSDPAPLPLVCDLDGTVTRVDTIAELSVRFVKKHPATGLFRFAAAATRGRAALKDMLYRSVGAEMPVERLPYARAVLEAPFFRDAPSVALVSGSAAPLVTRISDHLGVFTGQSDGSTAGENLIGQAKADRLVARYPDGFDYVGDSMADLPVWQAARRAYAANARPEVIRKAREAGIDLEVVSEHAGTIAPLRKGMRPHQWAKNLLLFAVPALNLPYAQWSWIPLLLLAFLSFGLIASATYLINDMLDIDDDRAHPTKRLRPFASGALGIKEGIVAIVVLGGAGMGIGIALGPAFASMAGGYALLSLLYSLYLKRMLIVDVLMLSTLFCWRILAGTVLLGLQTNAWFMAAMGAFFLSLAFGKRQIELQRKARTMVEAGADAPGDGTIAGRGYVLADAPVVMAFGIATGVIAPVFTLVYGLLATDSIIDHEFNAFAVAAILTFWSGRFWVLVNRGAVDDDPIIFAITDRISAVALALLSGVLILEQVV